MAKTAITFDIVRKIALEFPDLEESTMYGSPAIKLGKRLVACIPSHKSAEPGSLAVRTDFDQRPALLSEEPKTYYLTDHYANHPVVLVSLARMQQDQLCDYIPAARHCVLAHGGKQQKAGRHFSTGPQVP
jgi:hypothetical protein